jgi:putative peptidoglycan lipid II flippase
LADSLVGWELGIAPGFESEQQRLVVELMRLNLISTVIFSFSGLVMAGLQANQHFFLPALAPIFYNVGQIIGAVIFAPPAALVIGGITLPALNLGIHGLVYGVILGAALHLAIQLPGLLTYRFKWTPGLALQNPYVIKVIRLLGPRLITMFIIQLIFIVRDNLASRLEEGAVTALAYGWMIQQVPETLIGTDIGTALLPTLAEFVAKNDRDQFRNTIERAMRVLIAITLPVAVLLAIGLKPFLTLAFGFGEEGTQLLLWVTRGYLAGLTGHCLLELAARSFYAKQNAIVPLIGAIINVSLYILVGSQLFRVIGAAGISLTDAVAFSIQAVFLIIILNKSLVKKIQLGTTFLRTLLAIIGGGLITGLILWYGYSVGNPIVFGTIGIMLGGAFMLPFIWPELKLIIKL